MTLDSNKRLENKLLTEYRTKVHGTRWFLNRFFVPDWLQTPTKARVIITLAFWLVGVSFWLYAKSTLQGNAAERGYSFIDLFMIAATISMVGLCIAYIKGKKRQ